MCRLTFGKFLIAALVLVSFGTNLNAQEITGAVNGTVRDANGAAVPGAKVTIRDPSKSGSVVRTLVTNDNGEYFCTKFGCQYL